VRRSNRLQKRGGLKRQIALEVFAKEFDTKDRVKAVWEDVRNVPRGGIAVGGAVRLQRLVRGGKSVLAGNPFHAGEGGR